MPYATPETRKALLPTDLQIDRNPKYHVAWLASFGNRAAIGSETASSSLRPEQLHSGQAIESCGPQPIDYEQARQQKSAGGLEPYGTAI